MNSALYLKQFEAGPMANYVYFVGDKNSGEVFVVDPGWDVDKLIKFAADEKMAIKGILLTHTHFDHAGGVLELVRKTGVAVYVHKKEAQALGGKTIIHETNDGDKIKIGNIEITVIHTPGHTPGSQCFLAEGNLISGDTLFIGACGRCDLPGSDPKEMYESLGRLSKLPNDTVVYPGHDYGDTPTSTMGKEKQENPYLEPFRS